MSIQVENEYLWREFKNLSSFETGNNQTPADYFIEMLEYLSYRSFHATASNHQFKMSCKNACEYCVRQQESPCFWSTNHFGWPKIGHVSTIKKLFRYYFLKCVVEHKMVDQFRRIAKKNEACTCLVGQFSVGSGKNIATLSVGKKLLGFRYISRWPHWCLHSVGHEWQPCHFAAPPPWIRRWCPDYPGAFHRRQGQKSLHSGHPDKGPDDHPLV